MTGILVPDNVTISDGAIETHPDLVTRYVARRVSSNVVHRIPGAPSGYVSLGVSALRAGSLDLLYVDRAAAHEALDLHGAPLPFTYVDADQPERNMTYVVHGHCELVHDPRFNNWRLTVEFEEIEP